MNNILKNGGIFLLLIAGAALCVVAFTGAGEESNTPLKISLLLIVAGLAGYIIANKVLD